MSTAPTDPLGAVPDRSPACAALITATAERIEPRVEEIAVRLIDRVVDEMGLRGDEDLREDLMAAARGSVALITAMARTWTDPHVVPAPQAALDWARGLVARGLAIDALLRVYRIGQSGYEAVWFAELRASDAPTEVKLDAIAAISAFVFTWIDAIATPLVEAYEAERARRLRGGAAARTETVERLLAGDLTDADVAGARLGFPLDRAQIGLVAWSAGGPDESALEDRLAAVVRPLGACLSVRIEPRLAAAWLASEALDAAALDGLRARARTAGLRLAVATGGRGVDGFRRAHDHAQRARRVARLLRPEATLTDHGDVAVLDLLTRDLAAARSLAADTLGALAADDDGARRLLATLRIFFEEGHSFARTARRVGVHENTVAYRVRRAVELSNAPDLDAPALRVAVDLVPLLTET